MLHGIVLQFPLYAGIYGIFKATVLTERIGQREGLALDEARLLRAHTARQIMIPLPGP